MNTFDQIVYWLDRAAGKRQEVETAEAQQARVELQGLKDHPGWARLLTHLTEAVDVLQHRFAEGEELKPEERAFLKVATRLRDGPEFLLEDARQVIQGSQR